MPRRTFACALDFPGYCRSAKTADAALEALADYAARYAPVADRAGIRFPKRPAFEVVQRINGDASTDFGIPGTSAKADSDDLTARYEGLANAHSKADLQHKRAAFGPFLLEIVSAGGVQDRTARTASRRQQIGRAGAARYE